MRKGFTPTPERAVSYLRQSVPSSRLVWGFTLIELMVAMGLFLTVTTLIVSFFIQSSRAERAVAGRVSAIDNVALAIEGIAREIRTGSGFQTVSDPGGRRVDSLAFTNYRGESVVYRLNNASIEKSVNGGLSFMKLTSGSVKIVNLSFWMLQKSTDGAKSFPPRITIVSQAQGPFEGSFNLQTTVGSRLAYTR